MPHLSISQVKRCIGSLKQLVSAPRLHNSGAELRVPLQRQKSQVDDNNTERTFEGTCNRRRILQRGAVLVATSSHGQFTRQSHAHSLQLAGFPSESRAGSIREAYDAYAGEAGRDTQLRILAHQRHIKLCAVISILFAYFESAPERIPQEAHDKVLGLAVQTHMMRWTAGLLLRWWVSPSFAASCWRKHAAAS